MKNNNKGLTLVELIVAAAIFALISLGASFFMITSTRMHNNVNRNVQLQYDSQLAMSVMNEYIVDVKTGIAADNTQKALYLVNGDTVHILRYVGDDTRTLYYGTAPFDATVSLADVNAILAENVTQWDVTVERDPQTLLAQRVVMTMTMERRNKSYQTSQVIAVRNQPPAENTWGSLYTQLYDPGV